MKMSNLVRLEFKATMPGSGRIKMIIAAAGFIIFLLFLDYMFTVRIGATIPFMTAGFAGMATMMISSGPFMLEMMNDINTFYITQNIPRERIVNGRYLYGLVINFVFTLTYIITKIIILLLDKGFADFMTDIKSILISAAILFVVMQLYIAISYAIYFKFGYAKGALIASLGPMLILVAIFLVLMSLAANKKLDLQLLLSMKALWLIVGGAAVLAVTLTYISVLLSRKFYLKRDI
jgi:hypothetical protein